MALINNVTPAFASVGPLAEDEIWQVRDGSAILSFDSGGGDDRGLYLSRGESIRVAAGKTVYYRSAESNTCVLSREAPG